MREFPKVGSREQIFLCKRRGLELNIVGHMNDALMLNW